MLSSAQFAAYARDQIRTADVLLARHVVRGTMCSCGRIVPCSVALTVAERRKHFVAALARIVAAPAVGRAKVGRGRAVPEHDFLRDRR
jgi:hypothetical protein